MKWLLLTSLIIVGDLHLSGQLLDIYPPYLFGGMYLALLLTGIFVLNMRKESLVRNFNQAVTQQQRFKKITRKKIRHGSGSVNFPLDPRNPGSSSTQELARPAEKYAGGLAYFSGPGTQCIPRVA